LIQEDTAPPEITGEPHSIANILSSTAPAGTSEQLCRKGLLKGKSWFRFCLSTSFTLVN
jgi:hypothetical protein